MALHAVTRIYRSKAGPVTALAGVTASFAAGTFTAVMGPSGSGKSTLLHCAAGLDRPTSGEVLLAGTGCAACRENKLTLLRRRHVGFVFQSFNLLPYADRRAERRAPAAARRAPGRAGTRSARRWPRSAWTTGPGTGPPSCPAASSSGSPSPGRWSPGRR